MQSPDLRWVPGRGNCSLTPARSGFRVLNLVFFMEIHTCKKHHLICSTTLLELLLGSGASLSSLSGAATSNMLDARTAQATVSLVELPDARLLPAVCYPPHGHACLLLRLPPAACRLLPAVTCATELVRLHPLKSALCPMCRGLITGFGLPCRGSPPGVVINAADVR